MGTGDRWHEHGPVKDEDPVVSPAILLWMRGQGGSDGSELPWETEPEAASSPESTPDGLPEGPEVLANLLRAIESTETAARFQNIAPPTDGTPPADVSPEPGVNAAACSVAPPGEDVESNEALTNLLRAMQGTEIAATLQIIPPAEIAETSDSHCAQPVEAAEAASALAHEPESHANDQLEPAAQSAAEMGESLAVPAGPKPTDFRPRRATYRPKNHQPRRVLRRRNSDRQRSDYLLSIAAPTVAPVASAEAEPQHDELPVAVLVPGVQEQPPAVAQAGPVQVAAYVEPAESLASEICPVAPELPHIAVESEPVSSAALPEPAKPLAVADAVVLPEAPASVAQEPSPATEQSEPAEPNKTLPVIAAATVAESERPPIAKPARKVEAARAPAPANGATPKGSIPARPGPEKRVLAATGDLINEGLDRAEMHLENWFQKWFGPPDPRQSTRLDKPPLVAYHWIVDVPQALKIADISAGGLHLITKDRWSEGNIVSMTLQRTDKEKGSPDSWIAVDFLVMRWCEDGIAGAFMPSAPGLAYTVAGRAGNCADKKTLERFVERLKDAVADRAALSK